MDKALWNQVQPLLDKAIDMPAGERTAWLMRLREESPTIADELQRLLAREGTLDRRGFLDTPTSLDSLVGRMVDGSTATYQRAELERALAPGYELQAEVGRGGMATVFRARDTRHGRDVAIKVIRPDAASVLGAERFLAEIRLTANLTHPNILPLLDSGQAGGALFYVMPFIEGETLRARMRREGALPVDDVRRVLRSVLEALAHAHEKGLVHRDIKPDNVLLAGRQAWVADFGIAKAIASSGTSVHAATSVRVALGSPGYMAPEQIEGSAAIDARTDLYAVGAMAWEMLAGRPVFTGESMQQLFMRHLTAVPESLQAVRSDMPRELADAVMRCLAKAPGDRWPSATALLDALDAPSGADVAVHLPGRRGVLPRVAASLAIAVAGFLFWSAWDGQRLPTLGAPANITAFGDVGVARISPNAKWIVFRRGTEPAALWIQPADSGSPRRLAAGMPGLLGWIDDTTVFTVVPRQRPRMVSLGNPRSEDLAWAPTEGTWSVSAPGLVLFSPRREPGDSMQRMFWAGPAGWRDSLVIRVPRNLQLAWMAGDASAGVTAYGLRSADSAIAVIAYRPTDDADTILRVIPSDSLRLRRSIGGRPFAVASGRILYFPLLPDTLVRVDLSRPG